MGCDRGGPVTCRGGSGPAQVPTDAVCGGASPGREPVLKKKGGKVTCWPLEESTVPGHPPCFHMERPSRVRLQDGKDPD